MCHQDVSIKLLWQLKCLSGPLSCTLFLCSLGQPRRYSRNVWVLIFSRVESPVHQIRISRLFWTDVVFSSLSKCTDDQTFLSLLSSIVIMPVQMRPWGAVCLMCGAIGAGGTSSALEAVSAC